MAARTDVTRRSLGASTMVNWIPNALGPMSLRPGLKYVATTNNAATAKLLPFVYAVDNVALIEVTDYAVRIFENDILVAQEDSITVDVPNGNFTTDLTSWVDADEGGTATSTWLTGGYLSLLGDGTNAAKRTQAVSLAGDEGEILFLEVVIERGPVRVRVGGSAGDDDLLNEIELLTGTHVFRLAPGAITTLHIQLFSREEYPVLVDSCNILNGAASTPIVITAPWPAAYLDRIRYDQSGDVVFVDCYGVPPYRIQRYASKSWGVVESPDNYGPFRAQNLSPTTIAASALTGSVTLTASTPLFRSTHVGALFKCESNGQVVTQSISAQNTFTNPILVEGAGATRAIGLVITGTFNATVTLQRSVGAVGSWVDVTTYTTTQSTPLTDNLDNQIIYYRLGVKTGGYTSGTVVCTLNCSAGSIKGIAKITAVANSTSATAVVIQDFGSTSATDKWREGAWSDYRGWPSACKVKDGRLWHVGRDKIAGSVVDDFHNHDEDYIGDAGPIFRSIGSGPLDKLMWLEDVGGVLMAGGIGAEYYARASSQDEPMTPTLFSIRPFTTYGSASVQAIKVDGRVVFTDASEARVRAISLDSQPDDLTQLNPELLSQGVTAMAVQRRPDTRIHCVLSDGTVAMHLLNRVEEISAWVKITTDGLIEDAMVLPGTTEDAVYYLVKRTINSVDYRYIEKWALESECTGGQANKQLDSFILYSGVSTATLTGLSHLEAEIVYVWGNGVYLGSYTVSGGSITVSTAVTTAVIGLTYTANFESTKLAQSAGDLVKYKQGYSLGVMLTNTHASGLQYGPDSSNLDDLPLIDGEEEANSVDGVWTDYNYFAFEFPGEYSVSSRLYLRAVAPKPCTVLAAILDMEQEE